VKGRLAYLLPHRPKLSETFIRDEIDAIARSGVALDVYALRPLPTATSALGAQLYWLVRAPARLLGAWARALRSHAHSPKLLARAILGVAGGAQFAREMQRRGVGHVHAHFATHSALAAWVVERLAGIPYSFTAHADDIFVRRPMLEEKVAAASFVVAISEFNRRLLAGQIGETAARRIRVVHCGVPVDQFAPLPPASASHPFTILCVGRLEPKKGQRHLIEACRLLRERGIALRCWLVGEGRERARLERARDDAGLGDHVELLGARSRSEIRALVAEAHAFALPSVVAADGRTDGIPVALMEAMALERPVVSTRISGIPELIADGHSGRLVEPGDAAALADALEAIHRDAEHAAQLAREAARRVRERFDLHENAAELLRLFAGTAAPASCADGVAPTAELGEVSQ
jgi:glycosyltransferase involved in cell wall biosynthesis